VFITLLTLTLATLTFSTFAQDAYHDNIMIVVDDSGSMDDKMSDANGNKIQRMEAAKVALKEVLKNVDNDTYIGIVAFHMGWIFKLGPKDDAALNAGIDSLQPSGGTPLGEFIKFGGDCLLNQRQSQHNYGTYRLLIVTDGQANDNVEGYALEVMARGITVDVIGVDMDKDHALATITHSYRNAKDPSSLKAAIAEVLAEVPNTGDGSAGREAFELLAPLPDGFAEQVLYALANSGNYPIGESAPTAQQVAANTASSTNTTSTPPATGCGASQSSTSQSSDGVWFLVICMILGVFIFRSKFAKS
jgi:hypothetical protein